MKSLFFALFATVTIGQSSSQTLTKAIAAGDVSTISSYLDETVEVCLLNIDDFLAKEKAVDAIKSFYAKHSPKSFNIIHQGESKGKGSQYFIGNLKTNGDSFRVFIALENAGGKELIQQIRFEIE